MLTYCHVVCIPKLATQVSSDPFKARLHTAQQEDTVTKQVFTALQTSSQKPQGRSWRHQPLLRFRQLWPQLSIEDGVLTVSQIFFRTI